MRVVTQAAANFSFLSILFVVCLFMGSCSREEKPPSGTLPKDKMAAILTDIHIAESRVTKLQLKSLDSSLMLFNKLKEDIWKKYKVDTLNYRNSYSYYMSHPKQMSEIYDEVNKNIGAREKTNSIKL